MKTKTEKEIKKELEKLLIKSVKKNVPKGKFGLLLSGGLDSSTLALLLKKLDCNFTCYVAEFHHPNFKKADDVKYAKLLAKELGLKLKIVKVNLKEVETALPKVIKIIKRKEVPMVSIGLAIYFCLKQAHTDKIKTMLYDCVFDCVFAGLHKHRISNDIDKTCRQSLKKTYDIDFPRDSAIAKYFKIKLISPSLEKDFISFSLKIPKKYKIKEGVQKYILRKIATNMGLPEEIASRKKKSIQYGSNSQKMIKKLAKKRGFKKIKDYLESLKEKPTSS